jgi:hypothetical protein
MTCLEELTMDECYQEGITDELFAPLKSLRKLSILGCLQFTDRAFQHLENLVTLDMAFCRQHGITDRAFSYLKNLKKLRMSGCKQPTVTNEVFKHLGGLEELTMIGCYQLSLAEASKLKAKITSQPPRLR